PQYARAGIEHRAAMLGGADPDPAAGVFEQLRYELPGERAVCVRIRRHALEPAGIAPALKPGAAADPHVSRAIDEHAPRLIVGERLRVGGIVAEVIDAADPRIDPIQPLVGRDPHAALPVFGEAFDAIVRETA